MRRLLNDLSFSNALTRPTRVHVIIMLGSTLGLVGSLMTGDSWANYALAAGFVSLLVASAGILARRFTR